jgi:hypothetical protein
MTNEYDLSILFLYPVSGSLKEIIRQLTSALLLVSLISDSKCLA